MLQNYDAMKNGFASVTCATDVQNAIVKGNQATPEEQVLYDCFVSDAKPFRDIF